MKKVFLMLTVVFVSLFAFSFSLKAEEANLKCKYKNPFGDSDITIVFSDGRYDYDPSTEGYIVNSQTCIKTNDSSNSFNIYLGDEYSYYNAGVYGGKNWVFYTQDFEEDNCEFLLKHDAGGTMTCPELGYGISKRVINGVEKEFVVIRDKGNAGYGGCKVSGEDCKTLEKYPDNPSIDKDPDGNITDLELVNYCEFNLYNSKNSPVKLKFESYAGNNKFQVKGILDGESSSVVFDGSGKYAYTGYSNTAGRTFHIKHDDIEDVLPVDSNGKLTCITEMYAYKLNGEYFLVDSYDKIPKSALGDYLSIVNKDFDDGDGNVTGPTKPGDSVSSSCSTYLGVAGAGNNIASFLDGIWGIIKIGSILLVIVFSMFDFSKAVSNDKEKIPEVVKKSVLRLIFLVAILLLPTIIDAIGNLAGVENVLCGIK